MSGLSKLSELGKRKQNLENSGLLKVDIALIDPDPDQPRKDGSNAFSDESILKLALSIEKYGVKKPILVKNSDNGRYMIIDGERRWRASKEAGKTEIPVIIDDSIEDTDKIGIQVQLNETGEKNTTDELAAVYDQLKKSGKKQSEIITIMNISQTEGSNLSAWLKRPSFLKKACDQGKVSGTTNSAWIGRLYKEYGEEVADWVAEKENIQREDIKNFVKVLESRKSSESEEAQEELLEDEVLSANELDVQGNGEDSFSLTEPAQEIVTSSAASGAHSERAISAQDFEEAEENQEDFPFEESVPHSFKSEPKSIPHSKSDDEEGNDVDFENSSPFIAPVTPTEEISEDAEDRIVNPKIIVEVFGKRAILLSHKKAKKEGGCWIKYHSDGIEAEVLAEQVKLKEVVEG